jgi:hypothetical protein
MAGRFDREYIEQQMELKETDELLEILERKDTDEWQPEVFPIVEAVLRDRGVDVESELARARTPDERPQSAFVTAAVFPTALAANAYRAALDQAGIASLQLDPEAAAGGGVQLLVHEQQAEQARRLLSQERDEAADAGEQGFEIAEDAVACVRCGAVAISSEGTGDKPEALRALFGEPPPNCTRAQRCRECDYAWVE